MKYCDKCGNKLEERKEKMEWYCTFCMRNIYVNPVPTIDALLFDENGLVLVGERRSQFSNGKLNLPGGFVDPNETFEEAIHRELNEELGLDPTDYSQLQYAGSRVDFYTQDSETRQLLSVVMIANIKHRAFRPNEEVTKYLLVLPTMLKPDQMTGKPEYDHIMHAVKVRESITIQ